jgi:hypothetical protein
MIKYLQSRHYDHARPTAIHTFFILNNTYIQQRQIPSGSFYKNEQPIQAIIRIDEILIPVDKKNMKIKLKNSIFCYLAAEISLYYDPTFLHSPFG